MNLKEPETAISPVSSGRTVIFIDGAYLQRLLNDQFGGGKLDYAKLAQALAGQSELIHTYYYDSCSRENVNYDRFLNALRHIPGFIVRQGQLATGRSGGFVQKGVDVQLAVDLTRISLTSRGARVNNIIILTGDGDFVPAITVAKENGIKVTLVHGKRTSEIFVARGLIQACDGRFELTREFIDACRLTPAVRTIRDVRGTHQLAAVTLPQITRVASEHTNDRVLEGEVVDCPAGSTVSVQRDGIAIARPGSRVHALKGAVVYLHEDVEFTGTSGFRLIPVQSPVSE